MKSISSDGKTFDLSILNVNNIFRNTQLMNKCIRVFMLYSKISYF